MPGQILKLLKDGAPHRATHFIPPATKDSVIAQTPFAGHYQAGMKDTLIVR